MELKTMLNFLKWQIKNRIPGGGFYDRAFANASDIDIESIEYFLYLCDLYKNPLLKYIFGSYMIKDSQLTKFYDFMNTEFDKNNLGYYLFKLPNGETFKLPKPKPGDEKIYRTELLDLVLPYLVGYPTNSKLPFHEGPYEYGNVKLKPNDVVMDLGANFGMFSAYASSKGCKIYAFEPTENTINTYLSKTAKLNDNIMISNLAVSNANTMQEFTVDTKDSRCNGLSTTKTNLLKHKENKIFIQTTTLDNFVIENNINKVDFIKSDIEGAERLMLSGAREVLKEFEPDLSICYYHLLDDYKVLRDLILDANPDYEISHNWKKIYAYSKKRH